MAMVLMGSQGNCVRYRYLLCGEKHATDTNSCGCSVQGTGDLNTCLCTMIVHTGTHRAGICIVPWVSLEFY